MDKFCILREEEHFLEKTEMCLKLGKETLCYILLTCILTNL